MRNYLKYKLNIIEKRGMRKVNKKTIKPGFRMAIMTFSFLFKKAFRYKPSFLLAYILDIIVKAIIPFINIIFPKYVIDELLGNQSIRMLTIYVVCIVVGNFFTSYLSSFLQETLNKKYYDDFSKYFDALLGLKNMQLPYQSTEDKTVLERMQKAKDGLGIYSGGIGGIATSVSHIFANFIVLVGTLSLLIYNVPLVFMIVVVCVIVNYIFNQKSNQIQILHYKKISEQNRGFDYVLFNLSDIRYGKDFRLYHAEDMMLRQANDFNKKMAEIGRNQAKESLIWLQLMKVVMALREGGSFLYLGYLGLQGVISVANFMMLVNASNSFGNSLNTIITQIQELLKKAVFAYEYISFMKSDFWEEDGSLSCKKRVEHSIEFRNVTFSYPGSERKVLNGVSAVIKPGEKISIVGLNGAGKSTFIKLLCRLYKVDSGEILIDGVNINEYLYSDYIKLLSVVFQDFMLVSFSIKENIALKKSTNVEDKDIMPLIEEVGLKPKVTSLSMGIHTPVFKYYDKRGFEPSGGEQQKIAIARAIYKDAPIVILDEPTAALDPISEAEIYEQFNEMVNNKTAIFISHRLSSCKFCDRILVFKDGKVVENGTHNELVKIPDGVYANMYQTQAQYYQ